MLFAEILKFHNRETNLNLGRLGLYPVGKEITRATINKMCIADQRFPSIKTEEPIDDICRLI